MDLAEVWPGPSLTDRYLASRLPQGGLTGPQKGVKPFLGDKFPLLLAPGFSLSLLPAQEPQRNPSFEESGVSVV